LAYFLAAINRHDPAKFPPGSENAVHQTLDSQKVVDDMNCAYPERAALEFFLGASIAGGGGVIGRLCISRI
jgi:hypothetical protein